MKKYKTSYLKKSVVCVSLLFAGCGSQVHKNDVVTVEYAKPRVIHTTDLGADPDDEQSLVRQLVMANEFDIEGLIVATGCWKKSQSDTSMLDKVVDAYRQAYPNLRVHAEGFPSPDYLQSISVMGQLGYGMEDVGDGKDSPGSQLIIEAVDRADPRPVWATCWGGCNTIAQAVWTVKNSRTKEALEKFLSKLRVIDILGQDNAGTWLAKTFPDLFYIRATGVYGWQFDKLDPWWATHIQSHGPLGEAYPDGKYAVEGDTPAFLYLVPNGLSDPEYVDYGNWGGRFDPVKKSEIRGMKCMKGEDDVYDPYYMYGNDASGAETAKQWMLGYNNDFAARMDWSITPVYSDANHHPIAVVNASHSKKVLYLDAAAGSSLKLSALGSSDPDGDLLNYDWSFYKAPGTYFNSVTIKNPSSPVAHLQVPADASGKELHIILSLSDSGTPSLYAYRRIVVRVE